MVRAVVVMLLGAIACGGGMRPPLAKAGDEKDDGAGELAQASLRLNTTGEPDAPPSSEPRAARAFDVYGGDVYGGGAAADPYGGTSYAGWRVPQWTYAAPNRMPRYVISGGLSGAIEGDVTWNGQRPPKVTSACGPMTNPTLRVSSDKGVQGVIVYIEKVTIGRNVPYYSKPATVGGVLAKRGCALVPAAQIVTPLPGSVAIHGDTQRAKIRAQGKVSELQEAGLVQVEIKAGVTKIDSEDGKLAAAWVIGLETPYYAVTDDAGRFRIDDLAPGSYDVTFWQPPIASANRDGTWSYGPPVVVKRAVKVDGKNAAHLSVTLPVH